jgi:hypothetical protein
MSDERPSARRFPITPRLTDPSAADGITKAAIRRGADPEVSVLLTPAARLTPKVATLLGDTFTIVEEELQRMREDQAMKKRVKVKDLQSLGDLMFKLTKEVREEEKRNDVGKLDDETLLREMLRDPATRELVLQILTEYADE